MLAPEKAADPIQILAEAFSRIGFDADTLSAEMVKAGMDPQETKIDDMRALVFSERVTFDNQFGAYLPLIRQTGMPIVVIAPRREQQELIEQMNKGKLKDQKILIASNLDSVVLPGVSRFYYFRVAGDPKPASDQRHITPFDLTVYLKQIIAGLKKMCRLSDDQSTALDAVMERFRAVSEAA